MEQLSRPRLIVIALGLFIMAAALFLPHVYKHRVDSAQPPALPMGFARAVMQGRAQIDPALSGGEAAALAFAIKAAPQIYSFEADTVDTHFSKDIAPFFTDDGLASFQKALGFAHIADTAKEAHAAVTAAVAGKGKVVGAQKQDEKILWGVGFSLKVVTTTALRSAAQTQEVTLILQQSKDDPDTLKIMQWIAH